MTTKKRFTHLMQPSQQSNQTIPPKTLKNTQASCSPANSKQNSTDRHVKWADKCKPPGTTWNTNNQKRPGKGVTSHKTAAPLGATWHAGDTSPSQREVAHRGHRKSPSPSPLDPFALIMGGDRGGKKMKNTDFLPAVMPIHSDRGETLHDAGRTELDRERQKMRTVKQALQKELNKMLAMRRIFQLEKEYIERERTALKEEFRAEKADMQRRREAFQRKKNNMQRQIEIYSAYLPSQGRKCPIRPYIQHERAPWRF